MRVYVAQAVLIGATFSLSIAAPAHAAGCSKATGKENAGDLIAAIKSNYHCALPLHPLRIAAKDPATFARIKAAYAEVLAEKPDEAAYINEMSEMVDAAAGHPQASIARADRNAAAKPDDQSLLITQCWIRGRFAAQLDVAMKYCNAAVSAFADGPRKQPATYANRAQVELLLGNYAAAKDDYNTALIQFRALAPNIGASSFALESLYGRGIARIRLGDVAGGWEDIKGATNLYAPIGDDFADVGLKP